MNSIMLLILIYGVDKKEEIYPHIFLIITDLLEIVENDFHKG